MFTIVYLLGKVNKTVMSVQVYVCNQDTIVFKQQKGVRHRRHSFHEMITFQQRLLLVRGVKARGKQRKLVTRSGEREDME